MRSTSGGRTRWNVLRGSERLTAIANTTDATLAAALSAEGHAPTPADTAVAWQQRYPFEPHTVLGIGLNFRRHARDLAAVPTELPTVFFKARHTQVDPGESILLPPDSTRVTAEAELGLVIGRQMRDVPADRALDYVAGAVCVLDQTAEDILRQDTRLLTVAKNFETFFAFGPELVSLDELGASGSNLDDVQIGTYRNGECIAEADVGSMRFSPAVLLAFLSRLMPLEPGDIISTGTPGAAVLSAGDLVECRISGLQALAMSVAETSPKAKSSTAIALDPSTASPRQGSARRAP